MTNEVAPPGKKVLMVEDDRAIRRTIEFRLKNAGFNVLLAIDGEEGIALAQKEKPGLILLDLILPKLNGFETLKRLKADAATKDIPVVVFTNLSQEADEEQVRALGAVGFFVKSSMSLDRVVDTVREYLR